MNFFRTKQILRPSGSFGSDGITVVSGLPRSGTSMMMRMLEAGGMDVLTDHIRTPDVSNPKGYYEFERVKKLNQGDSEWLKDARGKAVKIISTLLEPLPPQYVYRIVFMQRNMAEILASQRKMLAARGEPADTISDDQLAVVYQQHLARILTWLSAQPTMEVITIHYNHILEDPQSQISRLADFLNHTQLHTARMLDAIDVSLYRQKQLTD